MFVPMMALVVALLTPAHDTPPPKHDDNGCCFQFDNSPVNLVFCTTKDACTIAPKP